MNNYSEDDLMLYNTEVLKEQYSEDYLMLYNTEVLKEYDRDIRELELTFKNKKHEIGDKILCINNEGYEDKLTKGKIYTVSDNMWSTGGYMITLVIDDENNIDVIYRGERFVGISMLPEKLFNI